MEKIENLEFGRKNPSEKERVWKEHLREGVFEQIIYYYQLKIPYNYFDLLENALEFKKNFENFIEAGKILEKNQSDEQTLLAYQEATDKISRLLLHESAIEISDDNYNWMINAGSALHREIEYTINHLIPAGYQKTILED